MGKSFVDKENLELFQQYINGAMNKINSSIDKKVDEKFISFIEDNVSDGEILDARGTERTLGLRLNKIDKTIDTLNHDINEEIGGVKTTVQSNSSVVSQVENIISNASASNLTEALTAMFLGRNDIETNFINDDANNGRGYCRISDKLLIQFGYATFNSENHNDSVNLVKKMNQVFYVGCSLTGAIDAYNARCYASTNEAGTALVYNVFGNTDKINNKLYWIVIGK